MQLKVTRLDPNQLNRIDINAPLETLGQVEHKEFDYPKSVFIESTQKKRKIESKRTEVKEKRFILILTVVQENPEISAKEIIEALEKRLIRYPISETTSLRNIDILRQNKYLKYSCTHDYHKTLVNKRYFITKTGLDYLQELKVKFKLT